MLRYVLGAAAALTLACAIVTGCGNGGGSSTTGGDGGGSTGGPPCKGASPDKTCYNCQSTACSDDFAAVESACTDFLSCEADCTCSDVSCLEACAVKITGDCKTKNDALVQCADASCGSECSKTPDAGSGAPDCVTLQACCPTLPASVMDGCTTAANAGVATVCTQELANLRAATYCPSDPNACATLATCCAAITDTDIQSGCQTVVQNGNAGLCSSDLTIFEGQGYCP